MLIDMTIAKKVLEVVDAGLSQGLGKRVPGKMCVEAAVCYALGLPHGDDPTCVSESLRLLKIELNDADWSSNATRAQGLRRLALIQLGTKGELDEIAFAKAVSEMTIRKILPIVLRAVGLEKAAKRCEEEGSREAALDARNAAYTAAYTADAAYTAAYTAANSAFYAADIANAAFYAADIAKTAGGDKTLAFFAEEVVQILVKMNVRSAAFLELAPLEKQ